MSDWFAAAGALVWVNSLSTYHGRQSILGGKWCFGWNGLRGRFLWDVRHWLSGVGLAQEVGVEAGNGALQKSWARASLVAQRLRICPPMQGTRVWSLVWEDPTCCGAAKPMHYSYWTCTLEPSSHNYWACVTQLLSPHATTTEPAL